MKSNQDQPSTAQGAYVADTDEEQEIIGRWLVKCGVMASNYTSTCADELIRLIEERQFEWIVVASAGRAFLLPDFTRFFRVLIETDTELWTADDDRCFSVDLFCFAFENWDFLSPYISEATEATSLSSVRDTLKRIETRLQKNPTTVANRPGDHLSLPDERQQPITKDGLVIHRNRFTASYKSHPPFFFGNTKLLHLLVRLARSPGIYIHIDTLRDDVWPEGAVEDATVTRTVRLLRAKLRRAGFDGITLDTSQRHHVRLNLG